MLLYWQVLDAAMVSSGVQCPCFTLLRTGLLLAGLCSRRVLRSLRVDIPWRSYPTTLPNFDSLVSFG